MSKSIYGIRMPGTMGDVINQLHGLRPLMARRATRLMSAAIARIATDHHDRAIILGADSPENPLSRAYASVRQRVEEIARTDQRDPEVDARFDVVLCDDGAHVIAMSFTEHDEWFRDLLSLPGAEDFCYWNGSDRPEQVSAEDWDMRRRTYERILSRDPHSRPAGCGVTLSFQKPLGAPPIERILERIPSLEVRALRMARQVILAEWASEQEEGSLDLPKLTRFINALSSPRMAEEVQARAEKIRPMLPEIDATALRTSAPAPCPEAEKPRGPWG